MRRPVVHEKPLVFFSHAHHDRDVALALQGFLSEALGNQVEFFNSSDPWSLRPGDPWGSKVIEAVRAAKVVLVVMSPQSLGRPWISFEAGGGWVGGAWIMPCCCKGLRPNGLLEPLAQLLAADLSKEEDIRRLLDTVAERVNVSVSQAADPSSLFRQLEALPKPADDSHSHLASLGYLAPSGHHDPLSSTITERAAAELARMLGHVGTGRIPLRRDAELVQALMDVASYATESVDAVDQSSLDLWDRPALREYLRLQKQLSESRSIVVTRVRVVEDQLLSDPVYMRALQQYVTRQTESGVNLRLCLRSVLVEEDFSWSHRGWMLADSADPARVAAAYGMIVDGALRDGTLLLPGNSEARALAEEFQRLARTLADNAGTELLLARVRNWVDPSAGLVRTTVSDASADDCDVGEREREKLVRVLQELAAAVASALSLSAVDLSACVWRLRPDRQVDRLECVMVGDIQPTRPGAWRYGEGIVGRCWKARAPVIVDFTQERFANLDAKAFRALPADLRMGMTWTEFKYRLGAFQSIWAVPVYRREDVVSVLSLNLGCDTSVDVLEKRAAVTAALRAAAVKVELVLP